MPKKYSIPEVTYQSVSDVNMPYLISTVRSGISFSSFLNIALKSPFSIEEWSQFLHLSERTMQRYKKEKRTFDTLQSEKILQITLLYKKGAEVFGSEENFNTWLDTLNLSLGKVKPKSLLDNAFGIELLNDELIRIEHGVLA